MRKNVKPLQRWTPEEEELLREYCPSNGPAFCREILEAHGWSRTKTAVKQRCTILGLRYTGPRLGCFRKGSVPANKGVKMSKDQYKKSKPTMFKKGNLPGNTVPIGTERFRSDGYTWKKTADHVWEMKHRIVWEAFNGPIDPDEIIVFKDGNPHNIDIDNLEALSRKEHVFRNRHGKGPSEYGLISGRTAKNRLKRKGIGAKAIRKNPELINLAQAETLLKLKMRKNHGNKR